jgi:hypothetical protein
VKTVRKLQAGMIHATERLLSVVMDLSGAESGQQLYSVIRDFARSAFAMVMLLAGLTLTTLFLLVWAAIDMILRTFKYCVRLATKLRQGRKPIIEHMNEITTAHR